MQNQEILRLINSTLFNQYGISQTDLVSFSASTGKFEKFSKNVIFGKKMTFSPKKSIFTFLLKTVRFENKTEF